MVVKVDRVLVRYYGIFGLGIQVVAAVLGQQVQCIREFQGYILIVVGLIIAVGSALGLSWSFSWGQVIFLARLGFRGFFTTV